MYTHDRDGGRPVVRNVGRGQVKDVFEQGRDTLSIYTLETSL